MCSDFWWDVFKVVGPSIFPSIVAAIGFYVFHLLALRRQKREEQHRFCENLKIIVQEISETASRSWAMNGKEAIQDGSIFKYKGLAFKAATQISTLCAQNKKYEALRSELTSLKKTCEESLDSGSRESIENKQRNADPAQEGAIAKASGKMLKAIDAAFLEIQS